MKKSKLTSPSIVIIGSGNLARQLIKQFLLYKLDLIQIISRSNKEELLNLYSGKFAVDKKISQINRKANIYFIITNDDSISEIIENWPFQLSSNQIITHCSGSVSSKVLKPLSNNYCVFWPIQSFSKAIKPQWKTIPICITSSNSYSLKIISSIAARLSSRLQIVNDYERIKLHMVAVIVNNFTNHLFDLSDQYLQANKLSFDLFLPIIKETSRKLKTKSPKELQTGPAIRKDQNTIKKHLKLLNRNKKLVNIYKLMTSSIQNKKTK